MNRDDFSPIGPGFEYVLQCFDALNQSRYSDAIRLLDEGLNRHLINPEQVDVMALLKHISALISYLEFRLEEDQIYLDGRIVHDKPKDETRCSFCGDVQSETKRIIAGPSVYICDECIKRCSNELARGSIG